MGRIGGIFSKITGRPMNQPERSTPLCSSLSYTMRVDEVLQSQFLIQYGTDEIHSQQVPLSPVAIPHAHDFESFNPCIDVLNDNSLFRQCAIERLLFLRQRMILAFFVRDSTVCMQRQ
jgi:hypothetical protein